jgi:hypothetical protein
MIQGGTTTHSMPCLSAAEACFQPEPIATNYLLGPWAGLRRKRPDVFYGMRQV